MRASRASGFGMAAVVCLASAASSSTLAQAQGPDAFAVIATYATTGRTDYRIQSRDEAVAWIKAWPAGVDRWIQAGTPDQAEQRAHVAALAAFEFARTGFDTMGVGAQNGLFVTLVEAAHSHLRRSPPGEFERRWLKATTGSLVSLFGVSTPPTHLTNAVERFPEDPRLRLNVVLADPDSLTLAREPGTPEDRLALSLGHGDRRLTPNRRNIGVGRAEPVFAGLLDDPQVGAEAKARLGWLRFHQNKLAESVALFNNALSATDDPFVTNLAALGLGLAHLAVGKRDEATSAFRAASAALPTARASTTALAMQLFLSGQRREASALLDRLAGMPNPLDPWKHVAGTDRFVDDIVRELRAELGVPSRVAPAAPTPAAPAPLAPLAPQAPAPTTAVNADDAASATPQASRTARPVFSTSTAMVSVDAAVLNGRRPVEGLVAADFEIRDNGVLQTIDELSLEGVSLDVSVVLDLRDIHYSIHYSTQSRGGSTVISDATSQGVADTAQFSALLHPDDRLRIVTATRDVSEPHPLHGPDGRAVHRVARETAAASALYDAMFTALARTTPPHRRHLVLVFTDGPDGSSIVTSTQLLQAAQASDALVRVFRRDTAYEFFGRSGVRTSDRMSEFLLWPHDSALLSSVAEATSGSLERVNSTGHSVVADVKRTLESFRQRYVLRYRPTGVEPGGWHDITVRVTRPGRLTVEARRGYFGG